jgi:nicotinamide-nucleotide amidase
MQELIPRAEKVARVLKERNETIVVAESSTGGLLSASLLALPGASAYFLGGAVLYTQAARNALMGIGDLPSGMRASTEAYALYAARIARERFNASWALCETGATGPTGNRYGDAPGHTCIAVVGKVERAMTLETGMIDRVLKMRAFSEAALDLLTKTLAETS